MKYYAFAIAACIFLVIPFSSIYAQYVSPYNSNGNVKSVEQRRYEATTINRNTYTPAPTPKPVTKPVAATTPAPRKVAPVTKSPATPYESRAVLVPAPAIKSIKGYSYDEIDPFFEGFARVRTGKQYGFIDESGKPVIPLEYDYAAGFREGLAMVSRDRKYGFVDKTGKLVIPLVYDGSGYSFYEGMADMRVNGKWGYIDQTGKTVIPFIYEGTSRCSEGLASVKLKGKWGYVNKTGKLVIPFRYDYTFAFHGAVASVRSRSTWGFINRKGVEIIPPIYEQEGRFMDGKVRMILNGKTLYFDETGKNVTPIEPQKSKEDRLKELKDLFQKELITKDEYEKAKQRILDEK